MELELNNKDKGTSKHHKLDIKITHFGARSSINIWIF